MAILYGQSTVGLLSYEPSDALDGYVLFAPMQQGSAFLLNNCGEVVHRWVDEEAVSVGAMKLQDDGSIFMLKVEKNYTNPWINGGGGAQKIEHRDWDNQLLWTYTYSDSTKRIHHDFAVMPNGNIVFIAWERKSIEECLAVGKDTSKLQASYLWPDKLVEVKPIGLDSAAIVWEWHAWDHLIQDFDTSKSNYGIVADHPELVDVNHINESSINVFQNTPDCCTLMR